MISAVTFSGCNLFGSKEEVDNRTPLEAPTYSLYDNYLVWDEVENAVGYIVSVNGVEQSMQTTCNYTMDTDKDVSVQVKAVAEPSSKELKDSDLGSAIKRQADPKPNGVLDEEQLQEMANTQDSGTYMIDLPSSAEAYSLSFAETKSTYAIVVPEEVRLIHVTTDSDGANVSFKLESRATPFILELAGAKLIGRSDNAVINASTSSLTTNVNVVIRSLTEENAGAPVNSITAGASTVTGSYGKSGGFFGGAGKGGTGGTGPAAVIAERVLFSGNASVTLTGGKGGTGGHGGDNSSNLGGDGGKGGTGGNAVSGKAYINIPNRLVSLLGGEGGAGGAPGSSFNLFASPSAGAKGSTGGSAAEIVIFDGEVKK